MKLTVSDFDGSVSSYVENPQDAVFHEDFLGFLEDYLAQSSSNRFVFLSARHPTFIANLVPEYLRWQVGYIGHYGLSTATENSPLILREDAKPYFKWSGDLFKELSDLLSQFDDVLEHVDVGVVVHTRWVDEHTRRKIYELVERHIPDSELVGKFDVEISEGSYNFNPKVPHDKGKALEELVLRFGVDQVSELNYLGDDIPDLAAFRVASQLRAEHLIAGSNFVVLRPEGALDKLDGFLGSSELTAPDIGGIISIMRSELIKRISGPEVSFNRQN